MSGAEFLWAGTNQRSCWGRSNSATEVIPPFDWYHLIYPRPWWFLCRLMVDWTRDLNAVWSNVELLLAFLFNISWVIHYVLYQCNDRKLVCLRTGFAAVFLQSMLYMYMYIPYHYLGVEAARDTTYLQNYPPEIFGYCPNPTCPNPFWVSSSCGFFTFFSGVRGRQEDQIWVRLRPIYV